MARGIITILGIIVAAVGGVVAYRAAFIAPRAAVVVTESSVREVPNLWRIGLGLALLVLGALVAVRAARQPRT